MTQHSNQQTDFLELATAFAAVAVELAQATDLDSAEQRIVQLAVARLGCQSAALWQVSRGKLHLVAGSDAELIGVMSQIAADVGSLGKSSLTEGRDLQVDDFTTETRWPAYVRQVVARTSIRSAAAFCLTGAEGPVGVLTLYSEKPHALTMTQLSMARIYAAHAGIALQDAMHVDQATNLQKALKTNRRIGMALGILIAQYKIDEQQAFDLLRVASQNNHVKLHDLAEEVIFTGAVPQPPTQRGARPVRSC